MTIHADARLQQRAGRVQHLGSLLRRLAVAIQTWAVMRGNRRTVAMLSGLDDYLLRDIGLTRQDVASALAEPFFQDASWRLAERALEARECDRAQAREALREARLMRASSSVNSSDARPANEAPHTRHAA
ncbi:MAG: DUF1127 domain-containing protein [Methylobacteriaceae bacterium]|nr:DUF1127 domain-containing protein [Methylobacteriaceae bacterium]MBV9702721.1 DUF1127 domain-containing protein [Methylobacteriaceae bacterium]